MPRRSTGIWGVACAASLALACASNGSAPGDAPSGSAQAGSTPTENPGVTAGLGVGSVLASAVYAPLKIVYATSGAIVGGLAWIFTAGDTDSALAVWKPSMSGDYLVLPDHLRDPGSIEFIGAAHAPQTENLAAVSAPPPAGASACTGRRKVTFAFDDATLDADARRELDRMVQELSSCPDQRLLIEGHTDSTGGALHNQQLSKQRARAVKDYLAARGVARSRFDVEAHGPANPLSSNSTREGRAANRRAEIALVYR